MSRTSDDSNYYLFVIDTDWYAGEFERQMCAYVTGCYGDCEVGSKEAEVALKELPEKAIEWFSDRVVMVADEHGCARPVSIFSTPGYWNDGFGNCWPDTVSLVDVQVVKKFNKSLKERDGRWLPKDCKIGRYPVYQSVAIFLSEIPTKEIVELMKERAQQYAKNTKSCRVTGFRILRRTVSYEELEL